MKAMYEARVEDLTPADHLNVSCACGQREKLTGAMLLTTGAKPNQKLMDLERKFRCRECDPRGSVFGTVHWHDAPP
jgi:hypothetical protein